MTLNLAETSVAKSRPSVSHAANLLIYINDIPHLYTQQDTSTKIYLYTDHAENYKVINQMPDQADLQAIMNTVKNWWDEWLLRLNIDKCKAVS